MRTARIVTNLRCNQNCGFCASRAPADDPALTSTAFLLARIDEALAAGAADLILTGGEPTLRRDLPALLQRARAGGARRIVLETNGTLVTDERATGWARAGLTTARVHLPGGDARVDTVTRDEGGFARALAGLAALARAGLELEVSATAVRSTLPLLPGLPAAIRAAAPGKTVAIVVSVPSDGPDARELLRYDELAAPLLALDEAARDAGLATRLGPEARPPPCVFPTPHKAAHLYNLTRGAARREGHVALEACGACQLADRCSGVPASYVARHGPPEVRPVKDDRTRRRLSVVESVADQVRREFVAPNRVERVPGQPVDEEIIRVQFACNQACRFCFVSTHLPAAGDDAVRAAIASAGARRAKIVLSGGEPTLHPRIGEFIRLAKAASPWPVMMETNAVRLADAAVAGAVIDAGLDVAFVSLHGHTPALSDAITEAPGTFVKTVAGLDRLAAAGIRIVLNFVICRANMAALPDYVDFVHGRWPQALLSISFVAPSADVVPQEEAMVPRYSEARGHVARALARAAEKGLAIGGFENMCGLPLCQVPWPVERAFELTDLPPELSRGEFVRAEACDACALSRKCYGLRRGYADLYGTGELTPVPPRAAPPPGD